MNTKDWLRSLSFSGGFDRNGSHNSGEYQESELRIKDYLHNALLEDLADAIDERNAALKADVEAAIDRVADMYRGDDGQAYKEARKFLERVRPEALEVKENE